MDVKEAISKLEQNSKFLDWKKTHNKWFLAHCFLMFDSNKFKDANWQIGYYSSDKDKIVTFDIKDNIEIKPESDVFKKPEKKIKKLNKAVIELNIEQILDILNNFLKENYKSQIPTKKILLLQNIESFDSVWNITVVTSSFNTINVKINPKNGEILDHKISSLFDLRKK